MIEANELFIIEELQNAGVTNEQIKKILKKFGGWRFYIRKKNSEYEEINTLYKQKIRQGVSRPDSIRYLAELFEKSESRVREITKKQGGLFEEN